MGQFGFFRNYLRKMSQTIFGLSSKAPKPQNGSFSIKKRNLALFASGAGSNALKIIEHFKEHSSIRVSLIVCNKPGAGVLQIAANNDVPVLMIEKKDFEHGNMYVKELSKYEIDFIVLAGFLWKMPEAFLNAFPRHMINIHPSLLPKYGGKGMYGSRVHEAVIAAGEKESAPAGDGRASRSAAKTPLNQGAGRRIPRAGCRYRTHHRGRFKSCD
jgi:formyltetrahydrofolate hydrolase